MRTTFEKEDTRPMSATAQRLFSPGGLRDPEPLTVLSHGKGQQSTKVKWNKA